MEDKRRAQIDASTKLREDLINAMVHVHGRDYTFGHLKHAYMMGAWADRELEDSVAQKLLEELTLAALTTENEV